MIKDFTMQVNQHGFMELYIHLENFDGSSVYAKYFALQIGRYKGNAGDT